MRIVVTVPWGQRLGGAETMLQTVLDGALDSGHELELVFLERGSWPLELRAAGLRVDVLEAGRLRDVRRWLLAVVRLSRILRRRQPDLILNWSAKAQLYGSPAALAAGMGNRVMWWQHAIAGRGWLDRVATLLPAAAVGCTSQTAADAQARLHPLRARMVVAAGVRRASAGPAIVPPRLPEGVPVVGVVGRLEPWKGQDRLLQAQAILHERGHRIHTLIVGGDAYELSSEYAKSLPSLVRCLGLAQAVTLTGQVPDAGPYIELMDILVNASDPEPFGIVLLEAMARGVAVVGVDAGGAAEIIEDHITGVLARSGQPVALADALEPLLSSPEMRKQFGEAGRDRYKREFTDVAMRERFFERLSATLPAHASVTHGRRSRLGRR